MICISQNQLWVRLHLEIHPHLSKPDFVYCLTFKETLMRHKQPRQQWWNFTWIIIQREREHIPSFLNILILQHKLPSFRPGTRGRVMKGAFLKRTLTSRSLRRARLSALFWNKTSVHLTACSRPASTQTNSLLLEIPWKKKLDFKERWWKIWFMLVWTAAMLASDTLWWNLNTLYINKSFNHKKCMFWLFNINK